MKNKMLSVVQEILNPQNTGWNIILMYSYGLYELMHVKLTIEIHLFQY